MTRMKADEETLVLGRVSRMLEQMDDARAQARIATYIFHRFTVAGDQILPVEDQPVGTPTDKRQLEIAFPASSTRPVAAQGTSGTGATRPAPTAGQETGATVAQSDTSKPVNRTGWDLSSMGSENDDEPTETKPKKTKGARAEPSKAPKVTAVDGGWEIGPDEEIEVKI